MQEVTEKISVWGFEQSADEVGRRGGVCIVWGSGFVEV